MNIPVFQQEKTKTCGLASMRMILGFYGISATEQELASIVKLHSFGLTTFEVAQIANEYGFTCTAYTFKQSEYAPLGLKPGEEISKDISQGHYVVPTEITTDSITFNDPWTGKANTVNIDRFLASVTIKAAGSEFLLAIEK
jgi:ABC-type bacteriocin/lantibiotic exporter with double-glycine peptidase domain